MKYKVLTAIIGGWEDCWQEDDKPMRFDTEAAAQAEIDEFIKDQHAAFDCGDMDTAYDKEDYKIVPEDYPVD